MAAEDRVHAVVDPLIHDLDLELVDLVYSGGRLKITIDHAEGLGTEMLTKATRLISHELDLEDPINGTYTLEVTSPGVERTLRLPPHYMRSIGDTVSLKLKPNDENLRRLKGELTAADDRSVTVATDGGDHTVSYEQIAKAKTVFEWGPAPKPGKRPNPNKKKTGGPSGSGMSDLGRAGTDQLASKQNNTKD